MSSRCRLQTSLLILSAALAAVVGWPAPASAQTKADRAAGAGPQSDGAGRGDRRGHYKPTGDRLDAEDAAARVCLAQPGAIGLLRHVAADRRASDDLAAGDRRLHDGAARSAAERQGAGNRHRQRLSGGDAQPAGERGLLDRDRRIAGQARRAKRSSGWATRTSTPKSATAILAGPTRRRSTRSSSPARRKKCRSR